MINHRLGYLVSPVRDVKKKKKKTRMKKNKIKKNNEKNCVKFYFLFFLSHKSPFEKKNAPDVGGVESCFILERNVFGLPTEHPSGGNLYSALQF